jgi:1,4-dihydroxy-2-naphthoyl-CoA hydrolase
VSIWTMNTNIDAITAMSKGNMAEHLGIEVTDVGEDFIKGTMPVDHRTQQYMGIVHGGASVALAETLGSIAANLSCKPGYHCVGLDINANHIRAGKPPLLTGIATPLHIGNTTMVWDIKIYDSREKLVCISRLTMAVLKSDP